MTDTPKTLMEAVRYYSCPDVCHHEMVKAKWPDGKIVCPHCGAKGDRIGQVATRRLIRCKDCRKQISAKVGTIFEDSPLSLDKWFVAVWAVANCKNGISSYELGRAIGVRQATAWFMLARIRKAMESESFEKIDGEAEADATYVGGRAANMHKKRREKVITGRGTVGKAIVHGVLKRGDDKGHSTIRASVIDHDDSTVLLGEVRREVRYGATVYTDQAHAYGDLALTHLHRFIDHSRAYAIGHIHTNGLENFWSLLKRGLGGTYIAVAPFHLFRYVAEQVYRFNHRKMSDGGRFATLLRQSVGKRLTYRYLVGIDDAGFMGIQ